MLRFYALHIVATSLTVKCCGQYMHALCFKGQLRRLQGERGVEKVLLASAQEEISLSGQPISITYGGGRRGVSALTEQLKEEEGWNGSKTSRLASLQERE